MKSNLQSRPTTVEREDAYLLISVQLRYDPDKQAIVPVVLSEVQANGMLRDGSSVQPVQWRDVLTEAERGQMVARLEALLKAGAAIDGLAVIDSSPVKVKARG
ncbi:MAG: hypothetical protein M3P51_06810 [Chloroflexota bacterium]|nr:hypothetical protein [Chloroflexota bacterium]